MPQFPGLYGLYLFKCLIRWVNICILRRTVADTINYSCVILYNSLWFFYFIILFLISWFSVLCQFLLYSIVTQSTHTHMYMYLYAYRYTHSFPHTIFRHVLSQETGFELNHRPYCGMYYFKFRFIVVSIPASTV